jgi:hypothetical protein
MTDNRLKRKAVANLNLVIEGRTARIERDREDLGHLTRARYGVARIAVVRHFLRYYIAYHKISMAELIGAIGAWTETQEKYKFLEIVPDEERIRRFANVALEKEDHFNYSTPELGVFQLLGGFLMSEATNHWMTREVYESLDVDVSIPEQLAVSYEGSDIGGAKTHAQIFDGIYHARGEYEGSDSFIEFHLMPVPESAVSRIHFRVMPPPTNSLNDDGLTPREQIEIMRNEARIGYGWHIGTKAGPSFGLMHFDTFRRPMTVEMLAAAEPQPEPPLKGDRERIRPWSKEFRARDIVIKLSRKVGSYDAAQVRAARSSQAQAIGPQLVKLPITEVITSEIWKDSHNKLYYMSLINTKG